METQAPARSDVNRFAQRLFAPLPARYDRLAEVLSMGQNGRWRRAMIDHIVPEHPALVLDVACGPAGVSLQIADRSQADVAGRTRPHARHAAPGPAQHRASGAWTAGSLWSLAAVGNCRSPTRPSMH